MQTKISTRKTAVVWFVSIAILFFMFMLSPLFFGLLKVNAADELPAIYDWMTVSEKAQMLSNTDTRYNSFSTQDKARYDWVITYDIPSLATPETISFDTSSSLQKLIGIGTSPQPNTIRGMQAVLLASNREGTREYLALDIKWDRANKVLEYLEDREVEVAKEVVNFFTMVDVPGFKYSDSTPANLWIFLDYQREFNEQIADNTIVMSFVNNSEAAISSLNDGTFAPTDTNISSLTIKEVFDRTKTRLTQNIDKLSLWVGIDDALADEFGIEKQLDFVTTLEAFETQLGLEPPIEETDPADKNRLTAFRAQVQALKTLVTSTSGHLAMLITQDDFIDTFFADILSEETLKEENQGKTNAQIKEIAGARYLAQITNRINTVEQNLSERIKRISNSNPLGIPGWAIFLALLFIVLVIGFAYMVHLGVLNYGRSKKQTAEARERKGLWPFNKGNKK